MSTNLQSKNEFSDLGSRIISQKDSKIISQLKEPQKLGARPVGQNFASASYTGNQTQPQSQYMGHSMNPSYGLSQQKQGIRSVERDGSAAYMGTSAPLNQLSSINQSEASKLPEKLSKPQYKPGNNLPGNGYRSSEGHTAGKGASGYGYADSSLRGRNQRSDFINNSLQASERRYDNLGERHSMPVRDQTVDPNQRISTGAPFRNSEPARTNDKVPGRRAKTSNKPPRNDLLTSIANVLASKILGGATASGETAATHFSHVYQWHQGPYEIVEALIKVQRVSPIIGISRPFHDEGFSTTLRIYRNSLFDLGLTSQSESVVSFLIRKGIELDSIVDVATRNYIKGVVGLKPQDNIRVELLESRNFLSHGNNMEIGGVFRGAQHSNARSSDVGTTSLTSKPEFRSEIRQTVRNPLQRDEQYGKEYRKDQIPIGKSAVVGGTVEALRDRNYYGTKGDYAGEVYDYHTASKYRGDRDVMAGDQHTPKKGLKQKIKETWRGLETSIHGQDHYYKNEEPVYDKKDIAASRDYHEEEPKKGLKERIKDTWQGVKTSLHGADHYYKNEEPVDEKSDIGASRGYYKEEPVLVVERKLEYYEDKPTQISKQRVSEREYYYDKDRGIDQSSYYDQNRRICQGDYYDKAYVDKASYYNRKY